MKMFTYKLNFALFLFLFQGYICQRRIQEGVVVNTEKKYVVYLLKASVSPKFYDGWLCGGALVSEWHIVTSAACVSDVTHLYAIAGYKKYVTDLEIHKDPCTREKKKKIVFICTPNGYEMSYQDPQKWTYIDIAVVKVESPYDFQDTSYASVCSYTPAPISVNYEPKYQESGTDAIVLGWGHTTKYREEMDLENYNQEMMNYAPTLIMIKDLCKYQYRDYEGMDKIIDEYMICTGSTGNLDDAGTTIIKAEPTAEGCLPAAEHLRGEMVCAEEPNMPEEPVAIVSRKLRNPANLTIKHTNENQKNKSNYSNANITQESSSIKKLNKTALKARSHTRRHGICQNDHGGPLVTWIGAHEVLIGVATAFQLTESLDCKGPYLYTSTQCNGAFLDCVFRGGNDQMSRRDICANFTREKGYTMFEAHISWKDHPDGPAENEKNMTTHPPPANTNINATANPKNFKEEKSMHLENNNSIPIFHTNNTETLDKNATTKAQNENNSKPINLTDITSTNVTKSATVVLTNATSMTIVSKIFANLTDTKYSNSKSAISVSKSNIENTITTILMKNASMSLKNSSTETVYLETSTVNLIENASVTRSTN